MAVMNCDLYMVQVHLDTNHSNYFTNLWKPNPICVCSEVIRSFTELWIRQIHKTGKNTQCWNFKTMFSQQIGISDNKITSAGNDCDIDKCSLWIHLS